MTRVRTFVAVDVPATAQGRLVHLQSLLRSVPGDVRWTTGPHLHITLRFLGEVEADVIPRVGEATVRAVRQVPPFSIELSGLGLFPPAGRPSVVWVGVGSGRDQLCKLQAALEDQLSGLGFDREERPFSPHVTLGRIREGTRTSWVEALSRVSSQPVAPFPVHEVLVMKSDLTLRGPIYTALQRVPIV